MSIPRFSVENSVLVNMFMIVLLTAGTGFAFTIVREMFPESRPDEISINVVYPSVQPEELEKAVTIKIEEAVRDVEGIEKVNSTISEGMSRTVVTLYNEVEDIDAVRQDIETELDAIQVELPDDLESISITKMEPTLPVISVALYGDGSEAELKTAARDLRDELLTLPGVSDIQITGIRDDEISVEVIPDKLREYNITFNDVALAIRSTNRDISAGNLKGSRSNIAVRTLGEELNGQDLLDIEILSDASGRQVYIKDVATIRDEFVETDVENYFNGKPSANLIIQKTKTQDAIQIATLVKAYVKGKQGEPFDPHGYNEAANGFWLMRPINFIRAYTAHNVNWLAGRTDPMAIYESSLNSPFQHNFQVSLYSDLSRFIEGRLDLMTRNGMSGLILVLITLNLFLDSRVAMWAALGLPVSFLGTFILMYLFGVSFNLLSMFGLIIVLGIIVDDAIVIGENIFRHVEEGMEPREAAIKGAEEVMWPVIVAVATTIAAFAPLMFIRGRIGDFMNELPIVVLASLTISLVEALFILPAHLSHLKKVKKGEKKSGFSEWKASFMDRYFAGPYEAIIRLALRWRYVTIALAFASVFVTIGMFSGGIVRQEFIQKMDSETLIANVEMPVGTVVDETDRIVKLISEHVNEFPEVNSVQMQVGAQINIGGVGSVGGSVQPHLGQLIIELLEADVREQRKMRSSEQLLAEMRKFTDVAINPESIVSGVNSVTWEAMNGGPAGKDIEIRVSGSDFDQLVAVSQQMKQELVTYDGVVDLDDNYDEGKRELQLRLRDVARATGVTVNEIGLHVRQALYGAEAMRITRNREDVKIMVRYPEEYRNNLYNIESMWIPAPMASAGDGLLSQDRSMQAQDRWIPISEVATLDEATGFTTINRYNQMRAISILGDVDTAVTDGNEVLSKFRTGFLKDLLVENPGVRVEFLGTTEERAKSFAGLKLAFPVTMLLIYMMLAGLFRSYFQPLVVMAAIPFGFQGAVIGHWLTDNPITILSWIGLVALSGIVVNDSLVLVDFINSRIRAGLSPLEASVQGSRLRLRAILLTTMTTAAGLLPLMFETSFQAKFLIPMAVTLTYGLIFATVLTLVLVPCLNMVFFDCKRLVIAAWTAYWSSDEVPINSEWKTAYSVQE